MLLLPAPQAKPSKTDSDAILQCTSCGFEAEAEQFIDGRDYTFFRDDSFDCGACGLNTVIAISTETEPEMPF